MKKYNFTSKTFYQSGFIYPDEKVVAVAFKNVGSTLVYINGLPLLPSPGAGLAGESFEISANSDNEFFSGNIQINFNGGSGEVIFIQQFYIE